MTASPTPVLELPQSGSPHIISRQVIASGQYQALVKITYIDPRDDEKLERERDSVFLVKHPTGEPAGTLMPNIYQDPQGRPCVILVQQFRPQYERDTLEFPGGMISRSKNEAAEQAAVREMEEETSKTGTVLLKSPRLTSEPVPLAATIIGVVLQAKDKTGPDGGRQRLDKGEYVMERVIPLLDLDARLSKYEDEGVLIDPRVWTFALGIRYGLGLTLTETRNAS
ncbi:putative Nudix hydrolase domain-containing protein [Seiridium cardinale]